MSEYDNSLICAIIRPTKAVRRTDDPRQQLAKDHFLLGAVNIQFVNESRVNIAIDIVA